MIGTEQEVQVMRPIQAIGVEPIRISVKSVYEDQETYANYPAFQRKRVWPMYMKRELIDTILRGHPIASITAQSRQRADGKIIHDVIDGQQRLSTLFDYLDDKFATGAKPERDGTTVFDPLFPHCRFSDLPLYAQEQILHYKLRFDLYSNVPPQVLGLMFIRQSKNQVPLSKAEVLSAYESHAIRAARKLAEDYHLFTGGTLPLYRGSTTRGQMLYMMLYILVLESMGGLASIGTAAVESLAKGFKDALMTDAFIEQVAARCLLVEHVYDSIQFSPVAEIIPLYQSVLLLDSAGYDLASSPRGIFSSWYHREQEEDRAQKQRGHSSLAENMRQVGKQQNYWIANLLGLASQPGLVAHSSTSLSEVDTLVRWMKCNRECPNCKERVNIKDIHAHAFSLTSITGTCRERNMHRFGTGN